MNSDEEQIEDELESKRRRIEFQKHLQRQSERLAKALTTAQNNANYQQMNISNIELNNSVQMIEEAEAVNMNLNSNIEEIDDSMNIDKTLSDASYFLRNLIQIEGNKINVTSTDILEKSKSRKYSKQMQRRKNETVEQSKKRKLDDLNRHNLRNREQNAERQLIDRDYLGKMDEECKKCKASHWLFEKSSGTKDDPIFTSCCGDGQSAP